MNILKRTLLGIYYVIIAFLLLFSIATLSVKRVDNIPNIFGFGFLAVNPQADSMVGDNKDSFNPGSLVFVKVLSEKEKAELDMDKLYEDRAVVSFYDTQIRAINTHRVVEKATIQGETTVRTQGDNEAEIDNPYLQNGDIIAIYRGKIAGVGNVITFMQTPLGFGLVVVLPTLLLLFVQGYILIKNIFVVKEKKLQETISTSREEERERIKKELLEEMRRKESEN